MFLFSLQPASLAAICGPSGSARDFDRLWCSILLTGIALFGSRSYLRPKLHISRKKAHVVTGDGVACLFFLERWTYIDGGLAITRVEALRDFCMLLQPQGKKKQH